MTFSFLNPQDGLYIIYDTASGAVIHADELEAYICDALDPCGEDLHHLPEKCPSDIRYELARFSSTEVGAAYEKIKQLHASRLIFGNSPEARIRTSGEYSASKTLIPIVLAESGLSEDKITYIN